MDNYEYSFPVILAKDYGDVNLAVLIKYIDFWLAKNKANGKHFYDGCYWTYNSIKAFTELFPWLSFNQVRRLIEKAIALNILKTGNYNKSPYDRTRWFTFTDAFMNKYKSILQYCQVKEDTTPEGNKDNLNWENGQIDLANLPNQKCENAKPIPDNIHSYKNTDKRTQINTGAVSDRQTGFVNSRLSNITLPEITIDTWVSKNYTEQETWLQKNGGALDSRTRALFKFVMLAQKYVGRSPSWDALQRFVDLPYPDIWLEAAVEKMRRDVEHKKGKPHNFNLRKLRGVLREWEEMGFERDQNPLEELDKRLEEKQEDDEVVVVDY